MDFNLLNNSINATTETGDFPNNMLFSMYKNAGPVGALILPAVLMNVAAVPGILSNLLLIFVTVKNKSLRGSTNFLLALVALFETMHQTTHFVFLFITVTGINFVPYYMAMRLQLHSIFGVLAAQMAMVSAAADRLFAVMCPMKHTQLTGSTKYLAVHTGLAIACGALIAVYAERFSMAHPFLPVTGYISDLIVLDMEIIVLVPIQILCVINIVLYVLVWVVVKKRSSTISNKEPQEKLFKSLVVIIGIVIGGYVFNNICRLVSNQWLQHNDVARWWANVFGGLILNIGASAETPTLYIFSTDYRRAINNVLARFSCCGCLKTNAQNLGILASVGAVTRVNAVTVTMKMPHRISLNSKVHPPNIMK